MTIIGKDGFDVMIGVVLAPQVLRNVHLNYLIQIKVVTI